MRQADSCLVESISCKYSAAVLFTREPICGNQNFQLRPPHKPHLVLPIHLQPHVQAVDQQALPQQAHTHQCHHRQPRLHWQGQ